MTWNSVAYPCKICTPGLNVEIKKIKHDAMRKVAEAPIIHNQSLSGIHHLHYIRTSNIRPGRRNIPLYNSTPSPPSSENVESEQRSGTSNASRHLLMSNQYTSQISCRELSEKFALTSGEDILTLRTFSSIIRSSSHQDSMKSVFTRQNYISTHSR